MNKNLKTMVGTMIVGICLATIGASAKAIIDVAVLKENKQTVHEDIVEIKEDIKTIRNYLIPNRSKTNGR